MNGDFRAASKVAFLFAKIGEKQKEESILINLISIKKQISLLLVFVMLLGIAPQSLRAATMKTLTDASGITHYEYDTKAEMLADG